MSKRKLGLASLVLALGLAAAAGASAAGVATPGAAFSPAEENIVAARICPITILCRRGYKPYCHYSRLRHRCVCRCVPRYPQ